MTDAHCHARGDATRHILCDPLDCDPAPGDVVFRGVHPWVTLEEERFARTCGWRDGETAVSACAGVGEIGLDRLKVREIPARMREVFAEQLAFAAARRLPVVLHGAKCWGEVVKACVPYGGRVPAFLFHGFSRAEGLLPDLLALNGFVSVGPAVLNDHAVNYRELVKRIPSDRLLVETDRTRENAATVPPLAGIAAKVAELRGVSLESLETVLEANADRFLGIA